LSLSSQKYGFGIQDLGSRSGKNLFQIPDPGVKKAPDPGSGSATLVDSNHCPTTSTFLYQDLIVVKLQLEREQRCKDHSLEIDQARLADVLISTCGSRGAMITPWRLIKPGQ
jgi:hypothetical protein